MSYRRWLGWESYLDQPRREYFCGQKLENIGASSKKERKPESQLGGATHARAEHARQRFVPRSIQVLSTHRTAATGLPILSSVAKGVSSRETTAGRWPKPPSLGVLNPNLARSSSSSPLLPPFPACLRLHRDNDHPRHPLPLPPHTCLPHLYDRLPLSRLLPHVRDLRLRRPNPLLHPPHARPSFPSRESRAPPDRWGRLSNLRAFGAS